MLGGVWKSLLHIPFSFMQKKKKLEHASSPLLKPTPLSQSLSFSFFFYHTILLLSIVSSFQWKEPLMLSLKRLPPSTGIQSNANQNSDAWCWVWQVAHSSMDYKYPIVRVDVNERSIHSPSLFTFGKEEWKHYLPRASRLLLAYPSIHANSFSFDAFLMRIRRNRSLVSMLVRPIWPLFTRRCAVSAIRSTQLYTFLVQVSKFNHRSNELDPFFERWPLHLVYLCFLRVYLDWSGLLQFPLFLLIVIKALDNNGPFKRECRTLYTTQTLAQHSNQCIVSLSCELLFSTIMQLLCIGVAHRKRYGLR